MIATMIMKLILLALLPLLVVGQGIRGLDKKKSMMMMMDKKKMMMMMNMMMMKGPGGDKYGEVSCDTCPSGSYNDGCNECACQPNGFPICTMRACSPYDIQEPKCHPKVDEEVSCDTCASGYFTPDGCNTCKCSDTGPAGCTKRACFPGLEPECIGPPQDCRLVRCAAPPDCEGLGLGITLVPPNQCCPICVQPDGYGDDDDDDDDEGPDCSAVSCLRPECENGQIPIVPEGECCPECSCQACATGEYNDGCNDCKCLDDGSVDCTDWRCFWQGIPKCSEEEPDCSAVSCIVPECKEGQVPIVPKGECCPQCSCEVCQNYSDGCNDCTCLANGEVACTDLYCFAPGEPSCNEPEKKQPSCETCWGSYYDGCNWCDCSSGEEVCDDVYCKRKSEAFCGVDCRMVLCAPSPPTCENGEEPTIPLGQCCPVCEDSPPPIDCSTVDCYFPLECESQGLFTVTQPGACCPECVDETYEPDCSAVTCPAPECQGDDQPFVPFGECCPVCPLTCDDCPGGYNDGCNECFCESDGSEGGCTERACLVQHAPFCIPVKEEEESVSDSIIEEEIGACTMDAKECPDGSFVGRDWSNNCEFEPCP
mmetsp:Transcript_8458/g.18238  ORF Transcript_8458/g.18238 Transcript_8458/m.18238 type:complete len:594 (+) Transcript_8458:139-1920(+)